LQRAGKVLIRRKDGRTFALIPERIAASPLEVRKIDGFAKTRSPAAGNAISY